MARKIQEFIEPGSQERFDLHQRAVVESGGPFSCELRVSTPDGRSRDLRIESIATSDTDATTRVSVVDVSDRVAAESALRDANRKLETTADARRSRADQRLQMAKVIADALPLALWIFDLDTGVASYFNALASGILGRPGREERTSLAIEDIVDPIDLQRFRIALASIDSNDQGVVEVSFRINSSTGEQRWLSSRLAVFTHDSDGQVARVICASIDVTDLRRAEERVQQLRQEASIASQRERRDVAVMLHDGIGQLLPLAATKLALARRTCEEHTRTQLVEVERLLVEAHTVATSLTYRLSPLDLREIGLVAAVEGLVSEVARDHGLRVTLRQEASDIRLADALEFVVFRTLRELLANVAKHAHVDEASVCLSREGSELLVVVEDHGVGFAPDPAQTWGWGLRSARERLDYLGGRLKVRSEPRCGTIVEIRVPLHAADADRVPEAEC